MVCVFNFCLFDCPYDNSKSRRRISLNFFGWVRCATSKITFDFGGQKILNSNLTPSRQLVGTWARAPWRLREFFSASLYVVCFGLVLCQTLNLAPFVQPYSLCNNTITGYNGASAKVNVVFTARRYALARSLLWAGVCPSVRHVRVLYPDG